MRFYEVKNDYITIRAGSLVALGTNQARARAHALEHIEGDRYRVRMEVGFKRGEVLGYDGEIPKILASQLVFEPIITQAVEQTEEIKTNEATKAEAVVDDLCGLAFLDHMEREELFNLAIEIGLHPHKNTGEAKLKDLIKKSQEDGR